MPDQANSPEYYKFRYAECVEQLAYKNVAIHNLSQVITDAYAALDSVPAPEGQQRAAWQRAQEVLARCLEEPQFSDDHPE